MLDDIKQLLTVLLDTPALKKWLSKLESINFKDLSFWQKALLFFAVSYLIGFWVFHVKVRTVRDTIDSVLHPFKNFEYQTYESTLRKPGVHKP